jgi:DNA-damage-inducible protein D
MFERSTSTASLWTDSDQIIESARTACFNSGQRVDDQFVEVTEKVEIGSGAQRGLKAVMLSHYACYLVIQNADPTKKIVAQGQTYFAIQTRRQELSDEEMEEQRRLTIRGELRQHNSKLADAAKGAGVIEPRDYAIFQNHGYMGLYGGLGAQDIHRRKGLKKSQHILDHMGSTELAANLFRATQAEDKLRREKITGKEKANRAHREVGAKVRQTIKELGGTMPEALPAVESIKKLESKARKMPWTADTLLQVDLHGEKAIQPDTEGVLLLPASVAKTYGQKLAYRPSLDVLAPWRIETDVAEWTIQIPADAEYEVLVTLAADDASAGDSYVIEAESTSLKATVKSTGGYESFAGQSAGTIKLKAGVQKLLLRPDGALKQELADVRAVKLKKVK